MRIQFLGAAGTVTGSKFLVQTPDARILVDCGLFQGLKQLRLRNREPLPFEPWDLDAVVLTHAHIDHSGFLPVLVREGFRGPVYASPATCELCEILLPDSGRLQEEEAEQANRRGSSRHSPALPLYTEDDARRSLERLRPIPYATEIDVAQGLTARLHRAGHILGASMVRLTADGYDVLFSGDIGRPNDPLMMPPDPVDGAEYLLLESTYGDRLHRSADPVADLAAVVSRTAERRGVVLIPAFAVGRAQTVAWMFHQARERGLIDDIPVYLDSPMAIDATDIFIRHAGEHRLSPAECSAVFSRIRVINSPDESRELSRRRGPAVIISASGMATGGRVLNHLMEMAPDVRNTILLSGYQGAGTRGAALLAGEDRLKIYGEHVPVAAEVAQIDTVSAHADYEEILGWLATFSRIPMRTYITHGEPPAADAMRRHIQDRFGWDVRVAELGQTAVVRERGEIP